MTDSTRSTGISQRDALRRLAVYVRPHQVTLVIALVLGLAGTATELISPLVARAVLTGIGSDASVVGPLALLVLVLAGSSVLGYVQTVMLGTVAERVIRRSRFVMLDRLLHARADALTGRTGGEMVSRVTSDTTLIREASSSSLIHLVNGAVSLVGTLALMAYLDVVLLGVTFLVIVIGGALAMVLMPTLAKLQQEVQEQLGQLGGRLDGVVRALRTVKSARAEDRELARLTTHVDSARNLGLRSVRIEAASWTLTGVAMNLVILVVLGLGAYRVSTGAMDVPTLVAFLLYVFGLMWPVMMLTISLTTLQAGVAAVVRIEEVTRLPQESDAKDAVTTPDGASGLGVTVLEAQAVSFCYGPDGAPALTGLDLVIPRLGHTALIGPSGAGKSTVFSMLLKFLEPESGRLLLDGKPYASWSREAVRRRVGYVEQDTPIIPGSVRDNVALAAPNASDAAVWEALRVVRLADRVGMLPHGIHEIISATVLSGGERQRLAIARAVLAQPEVLLLDEATAQLDAITEAAVATGVRQMAQRGAVVSIAHRLSTVMDADQIVVLEAGRVRAVGTHSTLLASDDLYAELVSALRIAT